MILSNNSQQYADDDLPLTNRSSALVETSGKIRILREPGHEAGLNKAHFDVALSADVKQWFNEIVYTHRTCKSGPFLCQKILSFYCSRPDTLDLALKLFAQAPDCSNPKANSLSTHFIKTLADYNRQVLLLGQARPACNDNLQVGHGSVAKTVELITHPKIRKK